MHVVLEATVAGHRVIWEKLSTCSVVRSEFFGATVRLKSEDLNGQKGQQLAEQKTSSGCFALHTPQLYARHEEGTSHTATVDAAPTALRRLLKQNKAEQEPSCMQMLLGLS